MVKNMIVDEIKPIFQDRKDAGERLASELTSYPGSQTVKFEAALDLIFVRKIPIPGATEAGYGAVVEDGSLVLNQPMVSDLRLTACEVEEQADSVRVEIRRRSRAFRDRLPSVSLQGKTVIIVDDGLASGYTMLAAVNSARQKKAAEIIVAVPAASWSGYDLVKPVANELVTLVIARMSWFAVASFYSQWHDLSDREVFDHLEDFNKEIEGKQLFPPNKSFNRNP